jgi:hypothetical protein
MRQRAWRLGAVAATLALLVLPTSASAKKHKKPVKLGPVITATATGATVATSEAESAATATCPAGKQAVGGGFSVPLTATNKLFVTSSFRTAAGDGWTVIARQEDGSGAAKAIAYCRKAKPAIIDAAHTDVVPSGSGQAGISGVACPAGAFLVSGGFQIETGPGGSFALPTSSLAISTSAVWSVQAVNNTTGARNFTTHAYCMPRIPPPIYLNSSSEHSLAMGAVGALSSPACPKPKKPKKGKKKKPAKLPSAGGFASQATKPIEIFSNTSIGGGVWSISGINVTGPTGSVHLTSQAICL